MIGRSWAPVVESAIIAAAAEFNVDQYVLEEIVRCESKGNPKAVNPRSGALGLGQHLPRLWPARAAAVYGPEMAPWVNPLSARVNARVTAWLLSTSGTSPWAPWSGHCSAAY